MLASARLRLPLRLRVWKGQAGEFAGAGVGSSLDFQDHRLYVPGDDPRHINWQAYARTGQYTMKLYREEVRPVVDLTIDASESMFYDEEKAQRSAEILYLVSQSARRAGADLAFHIIRGDAARPMPIESLDAHDWLEKARALTPTDAAAPPDLSRIPWRANAIRVLISDLLFSADPDIILRTLTQRQGAAVLFIPYLTNEAQPDWDGNYEFLDAERGTLHPQRIEAITLKKYRDAYSRHFSHWKNAATRHQTRMARVNANGELLPALMADALIHGALETV